MLVMENWDVIIVGAGSAGLAAAIYTVRSGLKTLVLDEKFAGGTIADAPTDCQLPWVCRDKWWRTGRRKWLTHARKVGAIIHDFEAVTALEPFGRNQNCYNHRATYQAKAVIFSTGSHYKEIGR